MRILTEAEISAAFLVTAKWAWGGGEGYDGVSGEGQNDDITMGGEPKAITGTNSGVVREG